MASVGGERVEFIDVRVDPARIGGRDLLGGLGPRPHGPRLALVIAMVVVVGASLLARRVGHDDPPPAPAAAAAADPVYGGLVPLSDRFGVPVGLVTADQGDDDDVVWVLGAAGRIARVEDGHITAVSPMAGLTALAVGPDGRGVFAATEQGSPAVVGLDPVSLAPVSRALAAGPVSALVAGVGSVWAASAVGVQGWTTDLTRETSPLAVPAAVTRVRSLAIVGTGLLAGVDLSSGTTAVLRLTPPGGAPTLTAVFAGPVTVVPGQPAFVAHRDGDGVVVVVRDDGSDAVALPVVGPLTRDATIWAAGRTGRAVIVTAGSDVNSFDCYDADGGLVGRMGAGDGTRGFRGPVVTTARAVYAITVDNRLARGGLGSCGRYSSAS